MCFQISSRQVCWLLRHYTEPEKADQKLGSSQQWGVPVINRGLGITLVDSQGELPKVGLYSRELEIWNAELFSSSISFILDFPLN